MKTNELETKIIEALIKYHGFNHKSAKQEVIECKSFIIHLRADNPNLSIKEIASLIAEK